MGLGCVCPHGAWQSQVAIDLPRGHSLGHQVVAVTYECFAIQLPHMHGQEPSPAAFVLQILRVVGAACEHEAACLDLDGLGVGLSVFVKPARKETLDRLGRGLAKGYEFGEFDDP